MLTLITKCLLRTVVAASRLPYAALSFGLVALGASHPASTTAQTCAVALILAAAPRRVAPFAALLYFVSHTYIVRFLESDLNRSRRLDKLTTRYPKYRNLVVEFGQAFEFHRGSDGHSHPSAAGFRTAANRHLTEALTSSGFTPYSVSKAPADAAGSRLYYGTKDLIQPMQNDDITPTTAFMMIDVDYHADMDYWLSFARPLIMYTARPEQLSGRTEDFSWRFVGDMLDMQVAGGANYQHRLWRYEGDHMEIIDRAGRLITYAIEQRTVPGDEFHRFIYLVPQSVTEPFAHEHLRQLLGCFTRFWPSIVNYIPTSYWTLGPFHPMQRFSPSGQMYNALSDTVSLAVDGSYHSVELPASVFEAVQERTSKKITPVTTGDVERILTQNKVPNPSIMAPTLTGLLNIPLIRNVIPTSSVVGTFKPTGKEATTDIPDTGYAATTPLVSVPATFASKDRNADSATIRGRVKKYTNRIRPPGEFARWAVEFIAELVPEEAVGCPIDIMAVREAQDKPAQRARFDLAEWHFSIEEPNELKAFIKTEPYALPSDPRNITTNATNTTVLLSCYTIPFKFAVLKEQDFYGPGMTPAETIERLGDLTRTGAISSDYTRFDGTISEWLQRNIVMAAYNRWCRLEDRPYLKTLLDGVFIREAKTKTGKQYDPGWGTRSGSPITTDGNTMINAFVSYCSFRSLGCSHRTSFDRLGVYCGDDGLVPLDFELGVALSTVSSQLGLIVEVAYHTKGPYPYCGRYFIDPATTVASLQDPLRTLAKINMVPISSLTREQAITNRAVGYLVTDRNTPLIGSYCQRVLEITGLSAKHCTGEERFKQSQAWPYDPTDQGLIMAAFCELTGLTGEELERFEGLLAQTADLDDFPVLFETEFRVKLPVIFGDELMAPPGTHNPIDDGNQPEHQPQRLLREDAPSGDLAGRGRHGRFSHGRGPAGEAPSTSGGPRSAGSEPPSLPQRGGRGGRTRTSGEGFPNTTPRRPRKWIARGGTVGAVADSSVAADPTRTTRGVHPGQVHPRRGSQRGGRAGYGGRPAATHGQHGASGPQAAPRSAPRVDSPSTPVRTAPPIPSGTPDRREQPPPPPHGRASLGGHSV